MPSVSLNHSTPRLDDDPFSIYFYDDTTPHNLLQERLNELDECFAHTPPSRRHRRQPVRLLLSVCVHAMSDVSRVVRAVKATKSLEAQWHFPAPRP